MISNPIETSFEDGEWLTKAQAAVIFEVSERTIENRIKAQVYPSKVEEGKTLVFIKKSKINSKENETIPINTKPFATYPENYEISSKHCEECEILRNQVETLRNELSNSREANARLQGLLEGKDSVIAEKERRIEEISKNKDEVIQAKDQAINAANAAVMLMEQQRQTLDALTPKQIETALKKPWWRFGL